MFYREAVFFLRTIAAVAVISATSFTAYSQTPAAGSDSTATSPIPGAPGINISDIPDEFLTVEGRHLKQQNQSGSQSGNAPKPDTGKDRQPPDTGKPATQPPDKRQSKNQPKNSGGGGKAGGALGGDTGPSGGTGGGADSKPNEELAKSRTVIPRTDDDLVNISSHAQALLETANACNSAKCPVLDCAATRALLQELVAAEGLLDSLYGNLIEAGATIAAHYANVAAQSGITSTQLAQAQDALAWLDYFERLGTALFDLASLSEDVLNMLKGDLDDKSFLEKLDSLYETLKDAEGLANDMATAGSDAAHWQTGSNAPPTSISPLSDATGSALGKNSEEMSRINDLKSNASDAAGTVDSIRKAMKEGKSAKEALKGEDLRKALEKIAFRELKNQADKKKKELEDQINELGKDLAAEQKTLAGLFKERQRITSRRNAAEDALAAVRRVRQSLAACAARACGASTLSRPQPPVSKNWGEGLRAINPLLLRAGAALGVSIEVKDYCPAPGETFTPGGPTDGPTTGGGTKPRHVVENNCPECQSIADALARVLDEIDFVNAEIERIERNSEQVKLLKERLAIVERQMQNLSGSIAELSAAIQQSKVFGSSVAPKLEFTLREYEASRQLMIVEASRLKRQIERLDAEKSQLPRLRDRLWNLNYDRHNLRGDLNYCQRDKCRTRTGGGTGGGITEGTSVCPPCRGIRDRLDDAFDALLTARVTARFSSSTDKEAKQEISRREEEVQRLRQALKKCVEACQEAGEFVEHVTTGGGNNPFDPLDPLGGGSPRTTTGCTGPQPAKETQTQACPSGQTGSIIRDRNFFCENGAWTPIGWWVISNTCVGCTGSPPVSEPRTIPCPTGQTGTIAQIRPYACVNSAWAQGGWEESSNTCTTVPPPGCTTPQPVSETQPQACPSGQIGTITQTRGYSCVGNTWMPGAWQTVSNSCTCDPLVRPQPDGQNIACPTGQTGTITQQRAYVCSNGSWVPGTNWVEVARTCTTPQTGCSTNFSGGNYVCGGSCGIGSAGLTVTSGSNTMTANPLGSNSNVLINCSGATASPQSTNLIILGLPGHTCTFTGASLSSFGIACRNNSGGSCSSSCSR